MTHTAQVTLVEKTVNADGTIQVTFDDGTGLIYGDEQSIVIDCEARDLSFPDYLKSFLVCLLADQGASIIGKTVVLDIDAVDGNIVKVI